MNALPVLTRKTNTCDLLSQERSLLCKEAEETVNWIVGDDDQR